MDEVLQTYADELKSFRRTLRSHSGERINKLAIRTNAEKLGTTWLREIAPKLSSTFPNASETIEKYSEAARRLIKVSSPNNLKSSYLDGVEILLKQIRDDFILPIKTAIPLQPSTAFDLFVANLSDPEENAYFQEAVDCAKSRYLRAATVLAWCAAIDRIHKKIESIGFTTFNVTSAQMASQQKGRYRKFNQTQNITSMSELRQVFDNVVLWIIEGMCLIDSNQHTRLGSCFDMRNHSAHPGDAPITEFNVMSMFSDIQQIVLENPKFQI